MQNGRRKGETEKNPIQKTVFLVRSVVWVWPAINKFTTSKGWGGVQPKLRYTSGFFWWPAHVNLPLKNTILKPGWLWKPFKPSLAGWEMVLPHEFAQWVYWCVRLTVCCKFPFVYKSVENMDVYSWVVYMPSWWRLREIRNLEQLPSFRQKAFVFLLCGGT